MKRLHGITLAGLLGFAIALGTITIADRALPPDLSRLDDLSLVLEDRNGRPLNVAPTNAGGYRLPVYVADVDRRYIDMLVTYEDKRFYDHPGIDLLALIRAFGQWVTNGRVISGGSTLTMQTARLLESRPRTIRAKFAEMFRALQLENRYSKDEILEMYMTLAPFGGRVDGLRAASLTYFGQEPKHLTDA
jgi:penicillin-binding protein 1C